MARRGQWRRWGVVVLCTALMVLPACASRPIFNRPGKRAPGVVDNALLIPTFSRSTGGEHTGGGAFVAHWGRGKGVVLSSLSNFGRFYPTKLDLSGADVSDMVTGISLAGGQQGHTLQASSPEPLGTMGMFRAPSEEAPKAWDVRTDLLAAKVVQGEPSAKFTIAKGDPGEGAELFLLARETVREGEPLPKQELYPTVVVSVDAFGVKAEIPSWLDLGDGSGYPLIDENGVVWGVLARVSLDDKAQSRLAKFAERVVVVQYGHFVGAAQIRHLLGKVR